MRVNAFELSREAEDIGVTPVSAIEGADALGAVSQARRRQLDARRGSNFFIRGE
jgi:hypothetical protein